MTHVSRKFAPACVCICANASAGTCAGVYDYTFLHCAASNAIASYNAASPRMALYRSSCQRIVSHHTIACGGTVNRVCRVSTACNVPCGIPRYFLYLSDSYVFCPSSVIQPLRKAGSSESMARVAMISPTLRNMSA